MILRHVIVATLVAPVFVVACGSGGPTRPTPGDTALQGTVEPPPPPTAPLPPFRPVYTLDIEDVIPSGMYTMSIEFDQRCGIPPSLNPMSYQVEARKGSLVRTDARAPALTGFVNNYSFMTWNLTPAFSDDFDSGNCAQPIHFSEPPLYACGAGFVGRVNGGLAGSLTGSAWVGDASARSCGSNARHLLTLKLVQ